MVLSNLSIVVCFVLFSSTSYAFKVNISPVISSFYENGKLSVTYRLPCDANFQGLAIAPNNTDVEIGIAFSKDSTPCMTLKPTEELTISWFSEIKGRKIIPMLSTVNTRLWKARNISFSNELKRGRQKDLRVVYNSKCGKNPFLLVNESEHNNLSISVYEKITKNSSSSKCLYEEKSFVIKNALTTKKTFKINILNVPVKDLERKFTLKIAKTIQYSIRRPFTGGISLHYQRKCNEAPIGLITTPVRKSPKNPELKVTGVGILVAYFYNQKCTNSTSKMITATFNHPNIAIPNGVQAKRLKAGSWNNSLIVRSPKISKLIKDNKFQGIVIDYYSACNRQIGALYSVDTYGNTSVGIIEKSSFTPCRKALKRKSLYQPFFKAYSVRDEDKFYPLKIRGA